MRDLVEKVEHLEFELSEAQEEIRKLKAHRHCPQCEAAMLEGDEIFTYPDGTELCSGECAHSYYWG